ncbi:MAG: sulfate permease [Gammaproteobacteria bacterium]|nr:sulfate permease [Gammaproteobacteria bacterium]
MNAPGWQRYFPIGQWLGNYQRDDLGGDITAGLITAILLIPQGMAYAMLAGLPPHVGLYASISAPLVYAVLGSSRTLAVGPVSVASIMVATALASVPGDDYLTHALVLAMLCGLILLLLGALRLGVLVNYISHPVLTGFTTGAAIIIVISQLGHLLGVQLSRGLSPLESLTQIGQALPDLTLVTPVLGGLAVTALLLSGKPLGRLLQGFGLSPIAAGTLSKVGPLVVVGTATLVVALLALESSHGVRVVGVIQSGLPVLETQFLVEDGWLELLPSAFAIALVGYVESVSVAKVLAKRRRQSIDPNQELIALGVANVAAAFSGTMPVAGGFSRTLVNYAAGARTQLAAIITSLLVAVTVVFFMPLFTYMPKAALAAIIVVAVWPLIRLRVIVTTWHYDRADATAMVATLLGVLLLGIEAGLLVGVGISLLFYLWRSARPHIAVVGRVPGTEHYRNVKRHQVETWDELLLVRVDESLYFANAGYLEHFLQDEVARRPGVKHLLLIFSAVNYIDSSALESLLDLVVGLKTAGVQVSLTEVKGPVMDRLERTELLESLPLHRVFLTTDQAVQALLKEPDPTE